MRGELLIDAIDLGIVEVGLQHPGLEVVHYQALGDPVEEVKCTDMRVDPSGERHVKLLHRA